jgi:hypothetical protein
MTSFVEALEQVLARGMHVNGLGETSPGVWSACIQDMANPPQQQQGSGATPAEALMTAVFARPKTGWTTYSERTPNGCVTYTSETAHLRQPEPEENLRVRIQAIYQVNPKLAQLTLAHLGL